MKVTFDEAILPPNLDLIKFSSGKPEVIFKLLTEALYQNPLNSMIREYISNARDAHREKGNVSTPIEVGIDLEGDQAVFYVRDFGPGLSPKRLQQNFTKLGGSTKRHTNDFIGGFGIGSKVGFAYESAFTVINRYGGKKTVYCAVKDSIPKLVKLHEEPIPLEDTGLEIRVPLKAEDVSLAAKYIVLNTVFWSKNPYVQESAIVKFSPSLEIYYTEPTLIFIDKDIIAHDSFYCNVLVDYIPYYHKYNTLKIGILTVTPNLSPEDVTLTVSRESIQSINVNFNKYMKQITDKVASWIKSLDWETIENNGLIGDLIYFLAKELKDKNVDVRHFSYNQYRRPSTIIAVDDKYFKHKYERFFKRISSDGDPVIPLSAVDKIPSRYRDKIVAIIDSNIAEFEFRSIYRTTKRESKFIDIYDVRVPSILYEVNMPFSVMMLLKKHGVMITSNKKKLPKKLYGDKDPETYASDIVRQLHKKVVEEEIKTGRFIVTVLHTYFYYLGDLLDKRFSHTTRKELFEYLIKDRIYEEFKKCAHLFDEKETKQMLDILVQQAWDRTFGSIED